MGGRSWQLGGALALGAWLGCGPGVFLCQDDASCEQSGQQGVCQSTGYCSFPDDTCESGQRYGELAGGTLAGTCVDPETITMDGSGEGPGPTTTPMTSGGTGTTDPTLDEGTTADVDTTPPPDTGPDPSTTGVPPDPSESSGGPVTLDCRFDDFDDDVIDPFWCVEARPGFAVSEHDGLVWLDFLPMDWPPGAGGQVAEVRTCDPIPLLGSSAVVHAELMPQVSPYTEGFLEVGNASFRLGLGVLDDQLYAFIAEDGSYSGVQYVPYEPEGQHFWRVRGDETGLVAEYSPDGNGWAPLYTMARDLTGEEGWVYMGAWAEMVPLGPDSAAFESLEVCVVVD